MMGICATMTKKLVRGKIKISIYYLITATTVALLLLFSNQIADSTLNGIKISVLSVIPSVFPFFVLADYLSSQASSPSSPSLLSKIFSIPGGSEGALICGMICGFPCGIKYAKRLYDGKIITKSDLERIIGLVNNPSLAFVISGVGMGMLKSLKAGIILYISVIFSTFLVSKVFIADIEKTPKRQYISEQKFNFVEAIKNAGYASLTVSSYIIFFSAILGIFKELVKSELLCAIAASFLEIGNAASAITSLKIKANSAFLLYGFCLGFSGFSVHLQAFEVLPRDISKKKYLIMKLLQGFLCGLIAIILRKILIIL